MPDHGHPATVQPVVSFDASTGLYTVSSTFLFMSGAWRIQLTAVERESGDAGPPVDSGFFFSASKGESRPNRTKNVASSTRGVGSLLAAMVGSTTGRFQSRRNGLTRRIHLGVASVVLSFAQSLLADGSPPLTVQVDAVSLPRFPQLRRRLMYRALEEGYVVVPAGGRLRVALRDGPGGVEVVVSGEQSRSATVAAGRADLVQLEVLHRTFVLLREVDSASSSAGGKAPAGAAPGGSARVGAPPKRESSPSLAFRPSAGDEELAPLIEQLVERGVSVRPPAKGVEVPKVCIDRRDAGVRISVVGPRETCENQAGIEISAHASPEELAEASARLQERVKAATPAHGEAPREARADASTSRSESAVGVDAPVGNGSTGRGPSEVSSYGHVAVEGGALSRGFGIEPAVSVSGLIGLFDGWGLAASALGTGSVDSQISTLDVQATVGPALRMRTGSKGTLTLAFEGGISGHFFDIAGYDGGSRWDYGLAAPLTWSWLAARSGGVQVTLVAGLKGRRRTHELVGIGTLWQREAWSVSALAGFFWGR